MINALTSEPKKLVTKVESEERRSTLSLKERLDALLVLFPRKLNELLYADVRVIGSWLFSSVADCSWWSGVSLGWFFTRCYLTFRFAAKTHPFQLLKILLLLLAAAMPWLSHWFENLIELTTNPLLNDKSKWFWAGGVSLYTLREFGKIIISPQAKELLTYLHLPSYAEHLGEIPVMRKNICTLCELRLIEKNGKTPRILFVVDDLDRCSHTGIVKVLEAVRLVLDLDNVIVIVAVDQKIALAALAMHHAELSEHHSSRSAHVIARDYLAKVIHMPITLKKSNADEVAEYLHSIWNDTTDEKTQKELAKLKDERRAREGKIVKQDDSAGDDIAKTVEPLRKVSYEPVISAATADKEPISRVLSSLSDEHKNAFIEWVNIFSLANSRQLKRLNNSYDLLRSYCPKLDSVSISVKVSNTETKAAYPMMLTLILMEYLNNLEDRKARKLLWNDLFVEKKGTAFSSPNLLNPQFIDSYRQLREEFVDLVENVEAFVLPAID